MKQEPSTTATFLSKEDIDALVGEALEIGSCNWDDYLSGNRWPEIRATPIYQKVIANVSTTD